MEFRGQSLADSDCAFVARFFQLVNFRLAGLEVLLCFADESPDAEPKCSVLGYPLMLVKSSDSHLYEVG